MNRIVLFFKRNWKWFIFLFLLVYFFSFPVLLFFDSAHYTGLAEIFQGVRPFASWDIYRGPIFPFLIFLSDLFLGKTSSGLQLLTFLFFVCMIFFSKKMIDEIVKDKKVRAFFYIVFFLFIIINPIVFGYYHSLLTEFVAATIMVVSSYLSWKLIINIDTEKKWFNVNYILILIYFVIMTPILWFLKQPYFGVVFFPLLAISLLQLFVGKGFLAKIKVFLVGFFSVASLLMSFLLWGVILAKNNLETSTVRSPENVAVQQMFTSFSNFELTNISINSGPDSYRVVEVLDNDGKVIAEEKIRTDEFGIFQKRGVIEFLLQALTSHPKELVNSYIGNYLALINVYKAGCDDGVFYYVENKDLNFISCLENCVIASDITKEKSNIFFMPDEMLEKVQNYEQYVEAPVIFRRLLDTNKKFSNFVFSMSFFLLPFVLLFVVIFAVSKRAVLQRGEIITFYLIFILLFASFLHLIFHSFLGGIIDRYAFPALISTVLGYFFLIFALLKHYSQRFDKKVFVRDNPN